MHFGFLKVWFQIFFKLNERNQRQLKKIMLNTLDQLLESQDFGNYSNQIQQCNNEPDIMPQLS